MELQLLLPVNLVKETVLLKKTSWIPSVDCKKNYPQVENSQGKLSVILGFDDAATFLHGNLENK